MVKERANFSRYLPKTVTRRPRQLGVNGFGLCRFCDKETKPPRSSFCNDECVHEWRLRTSGSYLRACVFERDLGVCKVCGHDTVALARDLAAKQTLNPALYLQRMKHLGLDPYKPRRALWEADHIIPVCEGGGACGLANIRTLCWKCHRDETRKLRNRLGSPKHGRSRRGRKGTLQGVRVSKS